MLWSMLNAICFFVCIIGAAGAARYARASLAGFAFAIGVGLVLGGGCTWTMWTVVEKVGAAVQVHPEPRRELYFRALYVAAVLWILFALFIADHLTSALMRLAA